MVLNQGVHSLDANMDFLTTSVRCNIEAIDLGSFSQKEKEARLLYTQVCFMPCELSGGVSSALIGCSEETGPNISKGKNKDRWESVCIIKQDANRSLGFITKQKQFVGRKGDRCSNT